MNRRTFLGSTIVSLPIIRWSASWFPVHEADYYFKHKAHETITVRAFTNGKLLGFHGGVPMEKKPSGSWTIFESFNARIRVRRDVPHELKMDYLIMVEPGPIDEVLSGADYVESNDAFDGISKIKFANWT